MRANQESGNYRRLYFSANAEEEANGEGSLEDRPRKLGYEDRALN